MTTGKNLLSLRYSGLQTSISMLRRTKHVYQCLPSATFVRSDSWSLHYISTVFHMKTIQLKITYTINEVFSVIFFENGDLQYTSSLQEHRFINSLVIKEKQRYFVFSLSFLCGSRKEFFRNLRDMAITQQYSFGSTRVLYLRAIKKGLTKWKTVKWRLVSITRKPLNTKYFPYTPPYRVILQFAKSDGNLISPCKICAVLSYR